jgi:2-polyprenyl-6-hydroxyphenyl methylase/3-demethylubiquinone-9 3-methyltransferase
MQSKAFYDYKDAEEALEAFLKAHDNLDDHMREKALQRFFKRNLPPVAGKEVLDVGAGGGIWTKFWLNEGASVTALDMHSPVLLGNKMRNPKAEFVEADATTVKLGKKFDIIFAKDLIEHLPDDEAFLQNMADHIKGDGYLFITTQNWLSLNYYIDGGCNFLRGNMCWCGYDPTHLRFYSFRGLKRKLNKAGFIPLKYWGTYHFPYRFLTTLLFRRLIEWKGFHLVDLLNLNALFPFNLTGYNIGVMAKKSAK